MHPMAQAKFDGTDVTGRKAYIAEHGKTMEAALSAAVNAAFLAQPADPVAFIGQQLQQRETKKMERADEPAVTECWLLTTGGKLYTRVCADKPGEEKGLLTADMQLVHASGVDPANIKACGTGEPHYGPEYKNSIYNVEACRTVMHGMNAAGLDLNNKATRMVMADLTALTDDSQKEAGEEALEEACAIYGRCKQIKVGTLPVTSGSPDGWEKDGTRSPSGSYVFMVVGGRMHIGPHEPDTDGARSAHMKQCVAIGCDPKDVWFAGSVRKGVIKTNSLFNSKQFRTALSALQGAGVLDTPGGHEARGQLKERFALTPCTPEQMQRAADLLVGAPTETSDEMMYLRKLGGEKMGTAPEAFDKMLQETVRWQLTGRSLNDEDVEFFVKRVLGSGRAAEVRELDLSKNPIRDEGVRLLTRAFTKMTNLETLNLVHNKIGTAGINVLAEAVQDAPPALTSLNLDGFELPIKQLKGTDPVESLDLKGIDAVRELDLAYGLGNSEPLGVASAILIAKCIEANGVLTDLDTRGNRISGEAAQELAQAVIGSASLEVFGEVPMKQLRADAQTKLDLSCEALGPTEAIVLAKLVSASGALTSLNLLRNLLDEASASMLAEIAQTRGISVCGLKPDQRAFVADGRLKPPDAILLASDLSQANVSGALTDIDLRENKGCNELGTARTSIPPELGTAGWCAIFNALRDNKDNKIASWDLSSPFAASEKIDAEVAKAIAEYVAVSCALTSLDLWGNDIGAAGGVAIGNALVVNASLTSINLLRNEIDLASANALAEVAQAKRISLCGIKPDQTEADFRLNGLGPPDAVILASDLSLTNVSGALTSLSLDGNAIGDEGAAALGDALRVNGALKQLSLEDNELGDEAKASLREIAEGRASLTLTLDEYDED